nr:b(0,+)-type amino acid transporter 1-like [Hydra vulgaris]
MGHYQNFRQIFKGSKTNISEICYAFYGGFWAYGGYNNLPTIAAELKNPIRDLPLAMWIGMILVTVFNLTVNAAYLTVMTPLEIATSNAVGVTFGNQVYGPAAFIIPVLVACSSFGTSNGSLISSSRMLNAVAQKGHVPKFLSLIHKKHHTPSTSLFFIVSNLLGVIGKKPFIMTYDNASNMTGQYNGILANIKTVNPFAIFIPCFAYSLSLVESSTVDCCRASSSGIVVLPPPANYHIKVTLPDVRND